MAGLQAICGVVAVDDAACKRLFTAIVKAGAEEAPDQYNMEGCGNKWQPGYVFTWSEA